MRRLIQATLTVALITAIGCTSYSSPGTNSEPVEVSGKLVLQGKPLSNVVLTFQPTASGLPAELQVGADGSYRGKVTPGKYTYFIAGRGGKEETIKHVPAHFRSGSMDRQVQVSGGELSLKLD